MSSIQLQSNATGAAVFTLVSPATATNRTLSIPDATTTLVGTDATQTLTNKTLTTPNIDSAQFATVSGTAPIYPCRAWVNFNGTGTIAIRGSGNVSSITDNGVADYTVNFTVAMPDTNYSVGGNCMANVAPGNNARMMVLYPNTTYSTTFAVGSVRVLAQDYAGYTQADALAMNVIIFR